MQADVAAESSATSGKAVPTQRADDATRETVEG